MEMSIHIELPPDEEQTLIELARTSGQDVASFIRDLLRDHLAGSADAGQSLDREAIESCERAIEGREIPSLEEVRLALSKIPGSMAHAVVEERDERY
jgi:hypothetical protein